MNANAISTLSSSLTQAGCADYCGALNMLYFEVSSFSGICNCFTTACTTFVDGLYDYGVITILTVVSPTINFNCPLINPFPCRDLLLSLLYFVFSGGFAQAPTAASGGAAGTVCANPKALSLGGNAFQNTATGITINVAGTTCTSFTGNQAIFNVNYYSFTPTTRASYTFSTCGTATFDTKILVQSSCTAGSVVTCNDDGTGCSGYTSKTNPTTLEVIAHAPCNEKKGRRRWIMV